MKRMLAVLLICILLAGCGQPEQEPEKLILVQENAYTLSDGTTVDHWQGEIFEDAIYKTSEGWELLRIPVLVDIANVYVADMESFADLNETAQANIRAYYEENIPELDVQALLESAWADCNSGNPEKGMFSAHYAAQNISPSACNETIICFTIETIISGSDNVASIEHISTVFHRQTGAVIDIWDLFAVSREQTMDIMADALAQNDAQYKEIRSALETECVIRLEQGDVEFFFPLGTLSWHEYDCYMYLDCEDLAEILHPWAITEKR